ncbi:hypothetical protein EJB05_17659, partial [Eragrostis curvula]
MIRLIDAVVKLKADMSRKIKVTNITGCSLFLQVIYLDSIDLGNLNLRHCKLPRISCFTAEQFRRMIAADTQVGRDCQVNGEFGCSKVNTDVPENNTDGLFRKYECSIDLNMESSEILRPLFSHHTPKYIEVLPHAAQMQFSGAVELEMDMFDVLLRRFRQNDDAIYSDVGCTRLRHFIETDFLPIVKTGLTYRIESSIQEQFYGTHVSYDVMECKNENIDDIAAYLWNQATELCGNRGKIPEAHV